MNKQDLARTSEASCGRLGDLANEVGEGRPPDPRQWRAIEQALDGQSGRWRMRRLALAIPVLAGLALWIASGRTLGIQTQNCTLAADGTLSVPDDREGSVAFDDGTRITLGRSVRGNLHALGFWRGAQLSLQGGHVDLSVVHRMGRRWEVLAGPFEVRVTGTRFGVDWSLGSGRFSLGVSQGEVKVSGGPLVADTSVRSGQRLSVDTHAARVTIGEIGTASELPAPAMSVKNVPEESPAKAAAAPTPAERHLRKRGASSSRLAFQDSSTAKGLIGKTASPPESAEIPELTPAIREWSATQAADNETPPGPAGPRRLTIGGNGQLTGGATGSVYVARGSETRFSSPANDHSDHSYQSGDMLCTRGTVYALTCVNEGTPSVRCDWGTNWGVMLGWHPTPGGQAWGGAAASAISMEFQGKHGSYGLVAHRAGDPPKKVYCVDNYHSGQKVTPSQFRSDCWNNTGESLPDFRQIDFFAVHFPSGNTVQSFKYCLSAINIF
ncbi:MAG TPA: FecR domain-containing protein [Polyangia bacterium]